ncbi:MAG: MarR family transcriptional regulator [Clostridia bacterium]|nr:MarR family transcriptional regulator [Clostridia bacterium]
MDSQQRERAERIRESIDALIRTMRLHHRIVERRVDGMGVHHSQHRMLMKLSALGTSASQKDIADAMDVSPACVARTLKHLSAEGLIEKTEGTDGRCNAVSLRPEGQKLVRDSIELFIQIGTDMFEGISDEELTALCGTLGRILDNLGRMERRDAAPETERRL